MFLKFVNFKILFSKVSFKNLCINIIVVNFMHYKRAATCQLYNYGTKLRRICILDWLVIRGNFNVDF